MNTVKNFTFSSNTDGLSISAVAVEPAGEPRGIVQLVHGMCEYKERYTAFMQYLADAGFVCVMHDHRGHGHSVKSKEDLGYFYDGAYEAVIEDTHQLTRWAKSAYGPDKPFTLLGHSMGSFVVRCYVRKYDAEIDRLIVVGSPSYMAAAGIGLVLVKMIKALKGDRAHSKFVDGLVNGAYEKKYASENTPHAWVCSDRAVVEKYNKDPYCNYTFTLQGYEQLVTLQKNTYDKKNWAMANPDLPIAFFSGEGDPCAITPADFEKAVQFMRDRGYKNVSGKMYPGMRHEVLNETGKARVYADMLAFIEGE